jgi:hypothetical protein
VLETSFQVPWTQKNVHFRSKSKNFGKPEVVCFSRTVSARNVVPSALDSENNPLPVEIEKFWKTGSSLFLENGKC